MLIIRNKPINLGRLHNFDEKAQVFIRKRNRIDKLVLEFFIDELSIERFTKFLDALGTKYKVEDNASKT
jgi:hypothetical protein